MIGRSIYKSPLRFSLVYTNRRFCYRKLHTKFWCSAQLVVEVRLDLSTKPTATAAIIGHILIDKMRVEECD
jgi:hypothetical protein